MKFVNFALVMLLAATSLNGVSNEEIPKLPIGMNLPSNNYFAGLPIYRDVFKTGGVWLTFNVASATPWTPFDTGLISQIPVDNEGYALEIPYTIAEGQQPQGLRVLINNIYKGDYVLTYDGEGELDFSIPFKKRNGKFYITFDGKGGHVWISVLKSKKGNHLRNIRILPIESADDTTTMFHPLFLEGVKHFHCLRFKDWMNIDTAAPKTWDQRTKPDQNFQGGIYGIAIEHAIELCNLLKIDGWFCVPHAANDDYIRNFAELVRDHMDPTLKVYLEYSNEIWNWGYAQAQWVVHDVEGALDPYVVEDIKKINVKGQGYVEKDAYMMQRTFKIWSDVFGPDAKNRLVRVAAVQHVYVEATKGTLKYLFKKDENGKTLSDPLYATSTGAGCDALSPGGYFWFSDDDAKKWESMDPAKVTPTVIFESAEASFWKDSGKPTEETGRLASAYGIDYIVYEGGQHFAPPGQKDWPFNKAIWATQTDPRMYDMYMRLFHTHVMPEVNCKLFCAYTYVGPTDSRFGSWGHLENLEQLKEPSKLKQVAPKYQALLDANIPRQ